MNYLNKLKTISEKEPEENAKKTYEENGPPPSGDLYRVVAKKQPMGHNGL